MPNINAPRGFKPVKYVTEGPFNGGMTAFKIASGYASNIFCGDVVKLLTTGYINLAAASDQMRGVLISVNYTAADGTPVVKPYWPSGTVTLGGQDAMAIVCSDPNYIFEAQLGNATTAPTQALIGQTFNSYTDAAGGNTASGMSSMGVDITTVGTGAQQWRLLQFVDRADNDKAAAYVRGWFAPALHDLRVNTGI